MIHRVQNNIVIEQVPVDYYQRGIKKNLLQRIWHTNKLKVILQLMPVVPKKVLDVGCASGWFVSKIADEFPSAQCYGIDIYGRAIEYGKKMYPKIQFFVADAHKLPFKNRAFDVVICTEVLEHVANPKDVVLEIRRVLKDKGVGIIELDSGSILFTLLWFIWRKFKGRVWNDAHLRRFSITNLECYMSSCQFKVIKKKAFNMGMAVAFLIEK